VMDDMIENSLYAARMGALLIGVFGLLALLLAAVGLYGVMAYAVSQRTREIGIRMALGARRADILNLVLREGMAVVAVGAGAGLVGAFAASRLVVSFLYGVGGTDATTYALTAAVLAAIGFVAILVPARRATKVNATVALRSE
jgi:putative ABC transport system permease protein